MTTAPAPASADLHSGEPSMEGLIDLSSSKEARHHQASSSPARRKFFVGGNWKCNGTQASVSRLVHELNRCDSLPPATLVEAVCAPPACYLPLVTRGLRADVAVGTRRQTHQQRPSCPISPRAIKAG
eukprot:7967052-Pyramimonas_sp.AAC.1